MTVAELIALLQTKPQELQVAYPCHSEYCLLEPDDISVRTECEARPDGWIQCRRPDMPTKEYLVLY